MEPSTHFRLIVGLALFALVATFGAITGVIR